MFVAEQSTAESKLRQMRSELSRALLSSRQDLGCNLESLRQEHLAKAGRHDKNSWRSSISIYEGARLHFLPNMIILP